MSDSKVTADDFKEYELIIKKDIIKATCLSCGLDVDFHRFTKSVKETEGEIKYAGDMPVINVPLCDICRKRIIATYPNHPKDQTIPQQFMDLSIEVEKKINAILRG